MSHRDHAHLRAFPLCRCGSLKRYGELACALCLSRVGNFADFLDDCTDLERRLAHIHVLAAAEHAARAARRETRRLHAVADYLDTFVRCEAGSVVPSVAWSLLAWSASIIGILWVAGYPVLP